VIYRDPQSSMYVFLVGDGLFDWPIPKIFRKFKSSQHGSIHPKNRNPILAHLCRFQDKAVLDKAYGTKWGASETCWGIYCEVEEHVGNSMKTWWEHNVNLMGTQWEPKKSKTIPNPHPPHKEKNWVLWVHDGSSHWLPIIYMPFLYHFWPKLMARAWIMKT